MPELEKLLLNNRDWVKQKLQINSSYFSRLSQQQVPEYLWIGCSDSRVPANEIVGLEPGEMFVHRNIANVVVHTDINCLSVIHYAVEVLNIKHIIVCGHYGCGGVQCAMSNRQMGLMDNWLRNIKDVYRLHQHELDEIKDEEQKFRLMCELNVKEQVLNVCQTSIVQNAWKKNHHLNVHGWIYDVHDGLLQDLNVSVSGIGQLDKIYRME